MPANYFFQAISFQRSAFKEKKKWNISICAEKSESPAGAKYL
jgi:hypothetical protein